VSQHGPDEKTRHDIEAVVRRLLKEAGVTEPPVSIPAIVEHLELDRRFYDLQDPGFLDRMKHQILVHRRRLVRILSTIKLSAVLLFGEDRIVLDTRLPEAKHDWATSHEVGHRVLPWHGTYFRGDTAQTLDPEWHEMLEAEANYAASELMFCGGVFAREAADVEPNWANARKLASRYEKSLTTTLRRFVEHGPDVAMAMLVSTPYWTEKPADQPHRWRHFVRSPRFEHQFSGIGADALLRLVDTHSSERRGGPVADFICTLWDDDRVERGFHGESFFNRHDLLTLFVETPRRTGRIVVPGLAAVRGIRQ
jgi:hypothetical protein